MNGTLRTTALVALLALAAIGITQGMMHGQPGAAGPGARGMPGMMSAAPTDELGFLQHMIPHHREAIESAEALLAVSERPELRELLQGIVETQTEEVERMQGWIAAWYPGADPEARYAPMMRDVGADASVADRERAWLEDMLMHHMMAVRDARLLLAGGFAEHPEVEALARDIVEGQTREMRTMNAWLGEWFGVTGMMGMPGMMGGSFGAVDGQGAEGATTAPRGFGMMQGRGVYPAMHGWSDPHGGFGMMPGPGGMPGGMMHHGFGGMGGFAGAGAAGVMSPAVAEALARAFLSGRGDGGSIVAVDGPQVTYEVRYETAEGTGVLLVDARTGEVREAPAE